MTLPLSSRASVLAALVVCSLSTEARSQTRESLSVWPSLRGNLGIGAGLNVAPDEGVALLGGLTVGAKLMLSAGADRHFVLLPDLGLSATQGYGPADRTLWSVGLSPGFLWRNTGIAWAPRALVGTRNDQPVWGIRNGLRVYFIASLLDLEVAHQYTVDSVSRRHELLVTASLDVGFLAGVLYSALHRERPQPSPLRPVDAQIAR